ncbi:MAG: DUF1648 domain-containing protein [Clostridiales bacterium]|nr:DUF1648 domain-containing protein [Clostridiales bacterium]
MVNNNLKDNNKRSRKNKTFLNECLFLASIFVSLFCLISFIVLWRFLPLTIPAHWNHDWVIDRYGSRNEIFINFITIIILLFTAIIAYPILKRNPYKKIEIAITYITLAILQIAYLIYLIALYDKYLINAQSFYIWFSIELIMCILLYVVTVVSIIIHSKKSI